jgi:DNA modification methylase
MAPYYEEDGITIYHANCQDILPSLAGIDLVFTSPPYNLGVSTGGGNKASGLWVKGRTGLGQGYGVHDDAMDPAEYVDWQRSVLSDCWATLAPTGAIFYNHKPRVQAGLLQTPFDLNPGLPVRQVVIWARGSMFNFSPTFYAPTCEWIVVFARPEFRLKELSASGVGDVWRVPPEMNNEHPAAFPVGLPARAIETTASNLVLDPFMGSGSTLRAAKDAGISAIGIEIEERYCEIAAKRLAQGVLDFGGAA